MTAGDGTGVGSTEPAASTGVGSPEPAAGTGVGSTEPAAGTGVGSPEPAARGPSTGPAAASGRLAPAAAAGPRARKPAVPLWRWATWWLLLAPALVVFYVIFLPAWLAIRIARLVAQARSR